MGSLAQNIKRLREDAGMSQEELAKAIGKTRSAISQYEHGHTAPRMGVIEDMAHVFRVSKAEIIGAYPYSVIALDTNDEKELVELFRKMNKASKGALLATARALAEQ